MAETGSAGAGAGGGADDRAEAVRATGFLQRALLRRRLRFLERRRELALHDLGGFVFESHRLGESRPDLEAQKLAAVDAIDVELARLQHALDAREELAVLREPGISSCPHCATIHDSAANYCPGCGSPRAGRGSHNGSGAQLAGEGAAEAGAGEIAVGSDAGAPPELAATVEAAEPGSEAHAEPPHAGELPAPTPAEPDSGSAAEPANIGEEIAPPPAEPHADPGTQAQPAYAGAAGAPPPADPGATPPAAVPAGAGSAGLAATTAGVADRPAVAAGTAEPEPDAHSGSGAAGQP